MSNDVYISPVGRLVFPYLNKARDFQGDGNFAFSTKLDIEGEAGLQFEQFLVDYAREYSKRINRKSISLDSLVGPALDKSKKPVEGVNRFSFKVKVFEGFERKPAFYMADGTPYNVEPKIGTGTLAEIAFTIYEWAAGPNRGFTLQPEGVRIIELTEGVRNVEHNYETLFERAKRTAPVAETAPGNVRSFPKRG